MTAVQEEQAAKGGPPALSDTTRVGNYNWSTLKIFAMRPDFETSARFVSTFQFHFHEIGNPNVLVLWQKQFNEGDKEKVKMLIEAQKDQGDMNPLQNLEEIEM